MATLYNLYTIGWYGSCDDQPCSDYSLDPASGDNSMIEVVYRVNTDNTNNGYDTFVPAQFGLNVNAFESLACGKAYIIKLTSAAVASGTGCTIDGFTQSTSDAQSNGYISDNCAGVSPSTPVPTATAAATPTPTPTITLPPTATITATPTATPTPTPTVTDPQNTATPTPTPTATGVLTMTVTGVTVTNPDPYSRDETLTFTMQPNLANRVDGYRVEIDGVEVLNVAFLQELVDGNAATVTDYDVSSLATGVRDLTIYLTNGGVDQVDQTTQFLIPELLNTPTPTASNTPTPTPTASNTPTPTPTITLSPTPTVTPTPTATQAKTNILVGMLNNITAQNTCGADGDALTTNAVTTTITDNDSGDALTELSLVVTSATGDNSKIRWSTSGGATKTISGTGDHEFNWDSDIDNGASGAPIDVEIRASHPGNDDKLPLSSTLLTSFTITKQTATLAALPAITIDTIGETQSVNVGVPSPAEFAGETVVYSSSDTSVATIGGANNDEVTIVGNGSTVIAATLASTDCHTEVTSTGTLTTATPSVSVTSNVNESITKSSEFGDTEGPSSSSGSGIVVTGNNITSYTLEIDPSGTAGSAAIQSWEYTLTGSAPWTTLAAGTITDDNNDAFAAARFRLKAGTNLTPGTVNVPFTINTTETVSDSGTFIGDISTSGSVSLSWSDNTVTSAGYEEGASPATDTTVVLNGTGLYSSDVTLTFGGASSSSYEWSMDNKSTWVETNQTVAFDAVPKTIYIRLKTGLSAATYNMSITASTTDKYDDGTVDGQAVSDVICSVTGTVTAASLNAGEVVLQANDGQLDFSDVQSFVDAGQTTFQREFTFYNQTDAERLAAANFNSDTTYSGYLSNAASSFATAIVDTVTAVVKVDLKKVGTADYSGAGGEYPGTETIYNASQRDTVTAGGWSDSLVNWNTVSFSSNVGYAIDIDGNDFITGITLKDNLTSNQTISDSSTITPWGGITTTSTLSVTVKYYITSTNESDASFATPAASIFTTERSTSGYTRDSYDNANFGSSTSDTFALAS